MQSILTRKVIAVGLRAWSRYVRLKHFLTRLREPRLGGLDHVTIPVPDLAAARAFYCDVLGAAYLMTVDDETFRRFGRPVAPNGGEGAHHVSVFMGNATRVDLFLQHRGEGEPDLGHPHYAFEVAPRDMLRWKSRLRERGIPVEGPLQLGPPGQASLYLNDPFGNHLELACLGFTGQAETRPPVMTRLILDARRGA